MHDVPFHFLIDADNELAESLGIAIDYGVPAGLPGGYAPSTVMPTVVVTNANGTIVFSDQTDNYRVRPEPDVFLAILRRSGAVAR
jgi:peroxiredoxin